MSVNELARLTFTFQMPIFVADKFSSKMEPIFQMIRYGEQGAEWKDIEAAFPGLRYKECSGINAYGEPQGVYAETFAETDRADVYVASKPAYKQTSIKLTLVFLEGEEGEVKADTSYHAFMGFVTGCKVAYRDTVRMRKVLMYLTGATEPKADTLYGQKYKEVTFTFTNVYGRTFGLDDDFPAE